VTYVGYCGQLLGVGSSSELRKRYSPGVTWTEHQLLGAALLGLACSRKPAPEQPIDVARAFVDTMQKAHGAPATADRLYQMLWAPARKNLEERARRASALSGRTVAPSEMLVPSWFTFLASPEPEGQRLDPPWAEVLFPRPEGAQTRTRLHFEEGHWKVALDLPELAPIRQRTTEGNRSDDD
jgi:hypothetical protein